jgi:hypothetical protein
VLLYADDAALPADTAEDLAFSMEIVLAFCNKMKLFISTSKTKLMVFHPQSDTQVTHRNGKVFVDGREVVIRVYGEQVEAVREFKYLGAVLDSTGSACAHFAARLAALQRAMGLLLCGLSRLPAFSHSFLLYIWDALVAPIALYGVRSFANSDGDSRPIQQLGDNAGAACFVPVAGHHKTWCVYYSMAGPGVLSAGSVVLLCLSDW